MPIFILIKLLQQYPAGSVVYFKSKGIAVYDSEGAQIDFIRTDHI